MGCQYVRALCSRVCATWVLASFHDAQTDSCSFASRVLAASIAVRRGKDMLIARAPLRISLGGGGTDLAAYYEQHGGMVVSTSINKYFYVVASLSEMNNLQIISADYRSICNFGEMEDLFWDGDLALPKAVAHHFGVRRGINLFLSCEVSPGTGLGSSSSAAVAMIKALSTLCDQPLSREELAELACT